MVSSSITLKLKVILQVKILATVREAQQFQLLTNFNTDHFQLLFIGHLFSYLFVLCIPALLIVGGLLKVFTVKILFFLQKSLSAKEQLHSTNFQLGTGNEPMLSQQ